MLPSPSHGRGLCGRDLCPTEFLVGPSLEPRECEPVMLISCPRNLNDAETHTFSLECSAKSDDLLVWENILD